MAEKNKKEHPQDWQPHAVLQVLEKIWMVLFSIIKIAAGALATVLLIVIVCGFVFAGMLGDFLQDDVLPDAGVNLNDLTLDLNSSIYYVDRNGQIQVQQEIAADKRRVWVSYEDIPEAMIQATIAVEDHRFYKHQGVDWITTLQACARMFFGDSSVGGSSITQQLVKNTVGSPSVTVQRKLLEIFQATELEKNYNKEQILEYYLNVIFLGQRCYGIRAAARIYYGKEVEKLTPAECASIIGITNSPTYYDPYQNPDNNKERKETILWLMYNQGYLTREEYEEEIARELVLKAGIDFEDQMAYCPNNSCGYKDVISTLQHSGNSYYCPVCGAETPVDAKSQGGIYSYHTDTVIIDVAKDLAARDGMEWNDRTMEYYIEVIQSSGYSIYSTMDWEVQQQVEKIYSDMSQIPSTRGSQDLQSAIVVIDNSTGDIVGIAGGTGEKVSSLGFNRATSSRRQSGSSIKPLSVYAPAFELGIVTPASVIKDLPLVYEDKTGWPSNDSKWYDYTRTIYQAVTSSINAVCAQTLELIGTDFSYDFSKNKFGLSTLVDSFTDSKGKVHSDNDYAPLSMGSQYHGVTVRDMAEGFAAFANGGVIRKARSYTKVLDRDGNVVLDNTQKSEQIVSQKTVDYMNYCLVNATYNGTGKQGDLFRSMGITTAGKTGTTSSNYDRWFCGFTGYYTAAVWCGFDQPESIKMVNGGNPAAQLFKKVMSPLHKGLRNKTLYNSRLMEEITICLDSGKIATEACENDIRVSLYSADKFTRIAKAALYQEDMIEDKCDKHITVQHCSGGGVATEYCHLFAAVDDTVTVEEKALVKLSIAELEEIRQAKKLNLRDYYLGDAWIWLVDEEGKDAIFEGVDGNLKQSVKAPYLICPVHDQAAWEEYQSSLEPIPPESIDPSLPDDSGTIDPGTEDTFER